MAVSEARELVERVERLLEEIESLPDPAGRAAATSLAGALLDLYGAGLERIVEEVAARDDEELRAALADDELVAHLLMLHGLHPVSLRERVLGALAEVRPYLESHGGDVELLAVDEPVVRLRMQGSCSGCPSSAMTLRLAIENAIGRAAPEIDEVIAEEQPPTGSAAGLLQIEIAGGAIPERSPAPVADGIWAMAGGLPELSGGGLALREISGQLLLFASVGGRYYCYRPPCPACEDQLAEAELEREVLVCPACGNRYDMLRAGRCLDAPQLHLEPVPLLVGDDGLVKVALPVTT